MFRVQLLDLGFFSLFFYLSPLCPGTCARSTDSFSPIISEISPTYSGVIICPFMTQQSSSILIFGTFIVTHSFAICSFRHWIGSDAAPCWHSLHTHTELPTFISTEIHEDWWRTFSYRTPTTTTTTLIHHRSPCSKLSPPPSFN